MVVSLCRMTSQSVLTFVALEVVVLQIGLGGFRKFLLILRPRRFGLAVIQRY